MFNHTGLCGFTQNRVQLTPVILTRPVVPPPFYPCAMPCQNGEQGSKLTEKNTYILLPFRSQLFKNKTKHEIPATQPADSSPRDNAPAETLPCAGAGAASVLPVLGSRSIWNIREWSINGQVHDVPHGNHRVSRCLTTEHVASKTRALGGRILIK